MDSNDGVDAMMIGVEMEGGERGKKEKGERGADGRIVQQTKEKGKERKGKGSRTEDQRESRTRKKERERESERVRMAMAMAMAEWPVSVWYRPYGTPRRRRAERCGECVVSCRILGVFCAVLYGGSSPNGGHPSSMLYMILHPGEGIFWGRGSLTGADDTSGTSTQHPFETSVGA